MNCNVIDCRLSHKNVNASVVRLTELVARCRIVFVVVLFLSSNLAHAQQKGPVKINDAVLARRAKAVELIVETADEARTFQDLFYRARIQALAAEALWSQDEQRARLIFRRAWEAATAYDKAEQNTEERESGVPSTIPITEARDEVLTKAAARDSKLGEEFLRELLGEKLDEKDSDQKQQAQRRSPWRDLSITGQRRLAFAYSLLNAGEPVAAARAAAPLVNEGVSADLITFILVLNEQDASEATKLYSLLLQQLSTDSQADAVDVLLISAPVISPRLLVTVDQQGALQFRPVPLRSPTIAQSFLTTRYATELFYVKCATVLLRPRVGAGSFSETIALYVAIGRLLPFFQNTAAQYVPDFRLRINTLSNEIEAGRRGNLDSQIALTSLTAVRPGDLLRPQIDQLGRARDVADRDRIALGIVKKAAQKRLWDRARRAAMEIEDIDLRRSALSYIAVSQIADLLRTFKDDKEENVDRMAKFVRSADVPQLVTAWGLAQTAVMATRKGDVETATALLDEAVTFAARTPAGTWQRIAAYTAVARMALRIDVKRAWEILPEIVRSVNAFESYSGDEGSIDIDVGKNNANEELEPLSVGDDVFLVDGLFAEMAKLDSEKALTAARSIGRETPRAYASLAIARIILSSAPKS